MMLGRWSLKTKNSWKAEYSRGHLSGCCWLAETGSHDRKWSKHGSRSTSGSGLGLDAVVDFTHVFKYHEGDQTRTPGPDSDWLMKDRMMMFSQLMFAFWFHSFNKMSYLSETSAEPHKPGFDATTTWRSGSGLRSETEAGVDQSCRFLPYPWTANT